MLSFSNGYGMNLLIIASIHLFSKTTNNPSKWSLFPHAYTIGFRSIKIYVMCCHGLARIRHTMFNRGEQMHGLFPELISRATSNPLSGERVAIVHSLRFIALIIAISNEYCPHTSAQIDWMMITSTILSNRICAFVYDACLHVYRFTNHSHLSIQIVSTNQVYARVTLFNIDAKE